jgi:group II intron reverse transcriptase/maturase
MAKWIGRVVDLACSIRNRIKKMNLQSKEGKLTTETTTGWPKDSNIYGHGSVVVPANYSLYRTGNTVTRGRAEVKLLSRRNYSGTGCTGNSVKKLDSLTQRCKEQPHEPVDRPLYSIICDPTLLELAYNNIKSKPGNMTPGITPETLDGVSHTYFLELSDSIKNQTFHFKPGRRIQIPKPSGGTRPLTIGSPRDKIVQEAMRLVLNAIYEPIFLENSHGFRPGKGCHTALKYLYTKFSSSTWMIEGDISKCFDTIDHNKLMNLVEKKILDRQFTRLIRQTLNAGYMEFKTIKHNIAGTPQGSIISPILANIFLHELDLFITSLKANFDKGIRAQNTPSYNKLRWRIRSEKRRGNMEEMKKLYKLSQTLPFMDYHDPSYKRLNYVRYADD